MGVIIEIIIGLLILMLIIEVAKKLLPVILICIGLYVLFQFWEVAIQYREICIGFIIAVSVMCLFKLWSYQRKEIAHQREEIADMKRILDTTGFISRSSLTQKNFRRNWLDEKVRDGTLECGELYDGDTYYYPPAKLNELNQDIERCIKNVVDKHLSTYGIYDVGLASEEESSQSFMRGDIGWLGRKGYISLRNDHLQEKVSRNELIERNYILGKQKNFIFLDVNRLQVIGESLNDSDLLHEVDLENNFGKCPIPVKELVLDTLREYNSVFPFHHLKLSEYSSETNSVTKSEYVWIHDRIKNDYLCSACGNLKPEIVHRGSKILCMDCLLLNALDEGQSFKRPVAALPPDLIGKVKYN